MEYISLDSKEPIDSSFSSPSRNRPQSFHNLSEKPDNNQQISVIEARALPNNPDKFYKGQNGDFTVNLVNNLREHLEKKNQTNQYKEINKQLRQIIRQTPDYDEVAFEEDDILSDLIIDDVPVPPPTRLYQERCKYCKRLYMLKENFEKHVSECIVKSLTNYIWEINYCLQLKQENQISTNQFVQRMVQNIVSGHQILENYNRGSLVNDVNTNDCTHTIDERFKNANDIFNSFKFNDRETSNSSTSSSNDDTLNNTIKFIGDPESSKKLNISISSNSSYNLIDLFANEDGLVDVSKNYDDIKTTPSRKSNNNCVIKATPTPRKNNKKKTMTSPSSSTSSGTQTFENIQNIVKTAPISPNIQNKKIECKLCGLLFATIQHLDQHFFRSHIN